MKRPMLHYDRKNDILYIIIRDGEEHHFIEVADGVNVEFDEKNQPIGIEIFNALEVITSAIGQDRLAVMA